VTSQRLREMLDEHLESAGMLANVFPAVEALGDAICEALGNGNQIITFGNGGSAAEAGHLAAELLGRAGREREPLAAIALNADAATVTAIANDYGYAEVFARQVRGLANAGDIVLGISTSGRSENVLRGLRAGHDAGAVTALLTGDAGTQGTDGVDHLVGVPSSSTSRIQELHLIVVHLLCEIVDAWAMDQGGASTRPRPKATAAAPSRPARSPNSAGRTSRSRTN